MYAAFSDSTGTGQTVNGNGSSIRYNYFVSSGDNAITQVTVSPPSAPSGTTFTFNIPGFYQIDYGVFPTIADIGLGFILLHNGTTALNPTTWATVLNPFNQSNITGITFVPNFAFAAGDTLSVFLSGNTNYTFFGTAPSNAPSGEASMQAYIMIQFLGTTANHSP
jgi:hypothetical protein